jgi:hypothetical protein
MKKDKSMPRGVRCGMLGSSVALLAATVALPVHAEYTFYENGGFKANAGLSSILGAVGTNDVALLTDRDGYFEAFLKPNLNFTWDMPTEGTIYGKVSGVGVYQAGDGDPSGVTNGDVGDLGLEEAYLGWRGQYLDVRAGRTEFAIGDQFLIGDCNFDANTAAGGADAHYDGSYWIAPYKACDSSVIVTANNGGAWKADAFYIKGDRHQAYTRIGGLNLEYLLGEAGADGKFGFMLATIPEASDFLTRQGMTIIDFRANGIAIPQVPGLKIHGEIAAETGDNNSAGVDYEALAYYGEGEYNFANVMWTPTVAYRYGHWSGDDDLTDNTVGNFDSLFYYAGPRGWGTWYQGEIAGEYQLFNSNQNTHMVKLQVHPLDTVSVTGLYFNHSLDEKQYFGTPVTDRGFMDEFNLVAEWFPNSNVYIAGVFAYGLPGDGYQEIFGTDDNSMVYELWAQFTY